ncbi:MAG: ElyC/SanA/YdcF family protein [Anaerolineae bacterium]
MRLIHTCIQAGVQFPHWRRTLALVLLVAVLLPLALIGYVNAAAQPHAYSDFTQAPVEPVAIVFGAGVTPNHDLTPMLADRVQTAANLYQSHLVSQVLMTGDGSTITLDEVNPMRRYAEARGVSTQDIVMDYAGFSTYESCYRARYIFGVRRAVLVTQRYHLARALYTCRMLGIDAVGVGAPDWGVYPDELMTAYSAREAGAILKALWEVQIAHPLPTYLGPYEGWRLHDS